MACEIRCSAVDNFKAAIVLMRDVDVVAKLISGRIGSDSSLVFHGRREKWVIPPKVADGATFIITEVDGD